MTKKRIFLSKTIRIHLADEIVETIIDSYAAKILGFR